MVVSLLTKQDLRRTVPKQLQEVLKGFFFYPELATMVFIISIPTAQQKDDHGGPDHWSL